MTGRRDALERHYDREEERLEREMADGRLSPDEYQSAARALQREAQEEARAARDEDFLDVMEEWR